MNRHFREDKPESKRSIRVDYRDSKGRARSWTPAADRADDRKHGIKEGSAQDNCLDKKRGVPVKRA